MVTGAGGSIGSELCRQIARLGPRRIVLLEMSELALYNIDRELRRSSARERPRGRARRLLGNAHHKYRVREIMQAYGVQTVYHAAAYKHVPIVEQNVIEGIHNNVISTWYTAEAALECGVETFVLISTDKAVNPTNVMGATKRLAEIVLQGLQQRGGRTRFCMVRFGNVLESSGSVVPLFREQIRRGGPVTVTHPDVIRYFMTIPEASQLVLQAGAMAQGGDVFVLDMGKPMRIVDLARRMVQLSGLTVRDEETPGRRHRDPLHRPAAGGEAVRGAADRQQRDRHRAPDDHACHGALAAVGPRCRSCCSDLLVAMGQFDVREARELLLRAVREYRPSGDIVDLVWRWPRGHQRATDGKVTSLQARRAAASASRRTESRIATRSRVRGSDVRATGTLQTGRCQSPCGMHPSARSSATSPEDAPCRKSQPITVHLIAAARPNFMKIAPLYHALAREAWCQPADRAHRPALRREHVGRVLPRPRPADARTSTSRSAAARTPSRPAA